MRQAGRRGVAPLNTNCNSTMSSSAASRWRHGRTMSPQQRHHPPLPFGHPGKTTSPSPLMTIPFVSQRPNCPYGIKRSASRSRRLRGRVAGAGRIRKDLEPAAVRGRWIR